MQRISVLCKQLRIGDLGALAEQVTFHDREQFLTDVLELAMEQRQQKRLQNLVHKARFPAMDMHREYLFDRITFPQNLSQDKLLRLDFLERRENLCFFGPCGTGKTRLAIMLGLRACEQGVSVQFHRTIDLVNMLVEAYDKGQARPLLERVRKCDVLILDEIGFIPFTKRAAEMLFAVVSQGYEHQAFITTSNLEFGRWNEIFGDDRLTAALIDRIVHRSHILSFAGPSRRLEEAMAMRGGKDAANKDESTVPTGVMGP